ncbi:MAG: hypothetical protein MUC50_16535 [Myxococcota bacterium]|jgi:hypothetical protein|nr:hypothetical protein [Myxococcota bacterium]
MPKGRILRVKQGYNPNSSSIGSVIFSMSAAVIPASILFGMVASALSTAVLHRVGKRSSGETGRALKQAEDRESKAGESSE